MKKLKLIGFAMLTGISIVLINGCAKDGATGPAGIPGTNGTNGNANVIGSNTISVTSSDWTLANPYYSTSFTASAITQAIVDKGAVIVYEKLGASWQCMPYTSGVEERDFTFAAGTFKIWVHNTDGTAPTNPGTQTYRIVAIAASNLTAYPNVNWKNYT